MESSQLRYPYHFSSGRVFDVRNWRLISARHNAVVNAINGSEVKPSHAVCWEGHGSLGVESASAGERNT